MSYKQRGFSPFTKMDDDKPKTFTGKIYENLDAVNDAIKNKKYVKNATGIYEFHFKDSDGKISTKTFRPFR
tara:strand:+ start:86 stop:298 length:213 start_codon:yes stop_codon:yes gene_type:complete